MDKITKVEITCFNCDTQLIITEPRFRDVYNDEPNCPVCNEEISNTRPAMESILRYNQVAGELRENLEEYYDNFRIY